MLAALIPLLTSAFGTIIDRVIPDKAAAEKAKQDLAAQLAQMAHEETQGQLDTNKAEAASGSIFVAGWRPWIGWVCGAALAYQYVVVPIGMWVAGIAGYSLPQPPTLDNNLWQLLTGMLGMSALRSFEKVKGVASK